VREREDMKRKTIYNQRQRREKAQKKLTRHEAMAQVILAMLVILDVFPLEVGAAASAILNPGEKKRRQKFPHSLEYQISLSLPL
jgi:hypothetical protein